MKEFTHEDYLRSLKKVRMNYCGGVERINDFLDAVEKSYIKHIEEDNSCETFKKYAPDDGDYESKDKMVSHPSHYQSKNGIEVIDVIEAFTEDLEGIEAVCAGNAIKYLCRWNKKNGVQDLEKSIWYIQKLINVLNSKNKEE